MPDATATGEAREMPQMARDFLNHLRRRAAIDLGFIGGGSAADTHLARYGHELAHGCCALAVNRCDGCREVLPRAAKVAGERYCSRRCREASATG